MGTRESGSQGRSITQTIREPGFTQKLIILIITLLMGRELPNTKRIARSGLTCGKLSQEPSSIILSSLMILLLQRRPERTCGQLPRKLRKMKDAQDEEERKKADEEAKKDEDDEDADDLDADEEDDIPEDEDEDADEPEHDEL